MFPTQTRGNHASEVLGVTPKTSLHRCSLIRSSLLPTPYSLLPKTYSLKPRTKVPHPIDNCYIIGSKIQNLLMLLLWLD
ncbi:MAG: hypothetical protein F6J90_30710 [Moorea sp. SIOASIH]|uniref:hypothetical protein n=1 Tax=Moorena sp. SIOASIH TaxID=2607817 RepID=UPI0013BB83B5|nr:hypothetical protein [Moorena sp. SIOASIH]NEO40476.1 hypothetical protein [Moorena sp. SIOASIH]